ncbi:protein containing Sulphatase-modifying factor [Candidatus Thiomargarita nelsonii]|uniref:Protein containing Sulphatase-modifying factor n=1 Tax=Candidatus Thiomargarita nelsonii TaxID=1003181 RepID=A0A176S852_9GAMM|nr:protein containing Sulphatase-modifying factor [Candidatus Thiomargarita nelsonii]
MRKQLIDNLKKLVDLPPIFKGENRHFTESELAAFLNDSGTLAITDLILAQLREVTELDDTLVAFFSYEELLGKATLFFFRHLLHNDARAKTTLETLQRECLLVKVDAIQTTQEQLLTRLQQQLEQQNASAIAAIQAGNFAKVEQLTPALKRLQNAIDTVPQRLQAAVVAWQDSHQQFIEFSQRFDNWRHLLDAKVDQVLDAVSTLGDIDQTLKTLLQEFRAFKYKYELSEHVKARDEFTHHSPESAAKIEQALATLKRLPVHNYELMNLAGTVVSSTGSVAEAEQLFLEARDCAQNPPEKALASFNLFQVRLRRQAYPEALADLQSAINLEPSYALHNVNRYPMEKLLGVGGMGCVFLCRDLDEDNRQVVVKCFWEGHKGARHEVFKEARIMREIAGDYVPKPLHWDYADAIRQEKPYFVTEYIEGALDGETWLSKKGKLDLANGLEVAKQIAQGLALAHQAGVCHFDLKPANLLLKSVNNRLRVKIIDFGLARVATSLKQQAAKTQAHSGKSLLVQNVFGTLDYAPPEQLGDMRYGEPDASSDVFAFGATLYRLLSGESPRFPHPSELPDSPELQLLLLDCLKPDPKKRPAIEDVIERLSSLLEKTEKKPGTVFRDSLKNGGKGPEMVIMPAGQFRMGDVQGTGGDREKPVHKVSVKSFAMGRYPVTVGEFRQFVESTGYKTEAEKGKDDNNWRKPYFSQDDNHPVVCVSWNDAVVYVKWLSEQTGKEYRLPTESEWEYGARGGTETDYWWGNEFGKNRANCYDSGSQWSNKSTSPVGSFKGNPFGLYDTVGNIWEWVADKWHENYEGAPIDGSVWEEGGENYRVLRGGSWFFRPWFARTANCNRDDSDGRNDYDGFRVVSSVAWT